MRIRKREESDVRAKSLYPRNGNNYVDQVGFGVAGGGDIFLPIVRTIGFSNLFRPTRIKISIDAAGGLLCSRDFSGNCSFAAGMYGACSWNYSPLLNCFYGARCISCQRATATFLYYHNIRFERESKLIERIFCASEFFAVITVHRRLIGNRRNTKGIFNAFVGETYRQVWWRNFCFLKNYYIFWWMIRTTHNFEGCLFVFVKVSLIAWSFEVSKLPALIKN